MTSIAVTQSASPFVSRSAPSRYQLTDLGAYLDGAPLLPVAINDAGDVCVTAQSHHPATLIRGFCLSGQLRVPAGTAFDHAPVTCLSGNGLMAGASGTAPLALRAWSSHLGTFGDRRWPGSPSVARGINVHGHLAGNVRFDSPEGALSRAFLFDGAGPVRLLTPPLGGTTIATGLNDAGDVVLNSAPLSGEPGQTSAWVYRHDAYIHLGSLGGARTWAHAIAPCGAVAGHSLTEERGSHAFLWHEGRMLDLGAPEDCMSQALALNDDRIVVGRVVDAQATRHAFRWCPVHGLTLLATLADLPVGWALHEALGVNAHGAIVGVGSIEGRPRGFVLTPSA